MQTLFGGSSKLNRSSIISMRIGSGRDQFWMVSLLSVEFGTTWIMPPSASMCADRQLISLTVPDTPPTSITSPTSNGRSMRSMRPEKRLPSGSCSARPTTMEVTPRAASAPWISRSQMNE